MTMMPQFSDMTLSNFFEIVLFLLSSLVTGPSFMSISSLALELWQFSFIRDWPEKRKYPRLSFTQYLETGSSYGYQICHECLWMLQNSRVTAFTVFELLRENQLGGGVKLPPPPLLRLGLISLLAPFSRSYFPQFNWNCIFPFIYKK